MRETPTSDPRQIPAILAELERLAPRTILDAGAGWGKYGVLCREYLDAWRGDLVIDAVEGFPGYLEQSGLATAYNEVVTANLAEWDPSGRSYDVILLIDVLEHFEREAGAEVLRRLMIAGDRILVATPREPSDQWDLALGDYPYRNPLEAHMSRWTERLLGAVLPIERFVPVAGDDQLVVTFWGRV